MKLNENQRTKPDNASERQLPSATPARQLSPDALITKPELAARLQKSFRTIERWQKSGLLPYVKCGRTVYYNWIDVQTHLRRYSCGSPLNETPEPTQ